MDVTTTTSTSTTTTTEKVYKTPEYTLRAQRAYRERLKQANLDEYHRQAREYVRRFREKKRLEKQQMAQAAQIAEL